jgi:signal transduction histidine kinase/DNA-binding response OmpR family regulator
MTGKKIIFIILSAFIIGNIFLIYIQHNSTKNINSLIEGNEKVVSELKVSNDFRELQKDIDYLDNTIKAARLDNEVANVKDVEERITQIEKGLQNLQQISDDDISVKYIDVLDTLIKNKLILSRVELYAPQTAVANRNNLDREKRLNDSIIITTQIIETSREKLLSSISAVTNKSGKQAISFSNILIVLVLTSGALLFWYIINIIQKQNQLITKLNVSQHKLQEASQVKEKFLANMSHEIRTPMNSILGFTNLLQNKDMDEDAKEYVHTIQKSGENLLLVVNDILDLSKIEAGMMRIESSVFNIRGLIDSIAEMVKVKADEKKILLFVNIDESVPQILEGDALRLTQICINLLGNAIKFTKDGSIAIHVKNKAIVKDEIKIELEIADTGIGISKENLTTIFERFNQAENDTTRKYGGTGLGLSIVKELVELQQGTIHVESMIDKGTTFFIVIPYKIANEEKANEKIIQQKLESKADLRNAIILVVEDNEFNQNLLKHIFKNWKVDFDMANNGQEAIDKLKAKSYSLILMDMQMPIMDGYTASVQIRNVLKMDTPIIAMTAHALAGEREKCLSHGMNDYIAKPIREKDLYDLVSKFVKVHKPKFVENNIEKINAYKYINLQYMKEISAGNKVYEKTVTEQFIIAIPVELEKLNNAISNKDSMGFKQLAHNMKTTVSIMGLTSLLQPYLDFFEYESSFDTILEDKCVAFKNICNAALVEANEFLQSL